MVFDFELHAEFRDHSIVEIGSIVCDDPFRDAIPTDKVILNKPGNNILGHGGKQGFFNPLREVINGDDDEVMSIGRGRSNLSNHVNTPHRKRPRRSQDV